MVDHCKHAYPTNSNCPYCETERGELRQETLEQLAIVVREFRDHETHANDKDMNTKEHVLKRFEIMERMYALVDSL